MVPSVDPEKPAETPEEPMTTNTVDDVIVLTEEQWDALVQRRLARLGLTYEELADMARRRDFSSIDALKAWYTIGPVDD
jgi:hypothetical protein